MALVIVAVMVVGMSAVVFADTTTTTTKYAASSYKITVTKDSTDKVIHTYGAYQIFKGDITETKDGDTVTEKILTNIDWGDNITDATKKATLISQINTILGLTGTNQIAATASAATVAKAISDATWTDDDATAKALAQAFEDALSGDAKGIGTTTAAAGSSAEITVPAGYYLVKDQAAVTGEGVSTRYILQVVSNVTPTEKGNVPSVKKYVDDVNDSATGEDAISWGKTADYDVNDIIPYKIVGTLPSNYSDYERYYYKFSDTMTNLTLFEDTTHVTKVYVFPNKTTADGDTTATGSGGVDITNYFTIGTKDTINLSVEVKNFATSGTDKLGLKNIPTATANITKDSVIVVYYYAKLGESAVIGNNGNKNEVTLEYSNNPNNDKSGEKGTTPKDTNVVFTYKVDVDKVVKNSSNEYEAKAGAGFSLYKQFSSKEKMNAAGYTDDKNIAGTTPVGATPTTFPSGEFWVLIKTISTGTNFSFDRIDDGNYALVESTTPDGYNTIDPIKFTITAEIGESASSDTGYAISSLSAGSSFVASASGGTFSFTRSDGTSATKKIDESTSLTSGEIYSQIINNSGTTLPSTGGRGTTIFYIIGGVIVVGAGILLVTRRKMRAQ